ncbi:MAG: phospholipid/cholesterol/gamma-HCH transport system substrate-binding protein [Paracoccaceae bacterium]|jgi:phospholipid/cholesterol/gamma-HCH transport system substrate-binding protein
MSENTTEVIVGGVVLAAAVGFFIFVGQVTGFERQSDSYHLTASFRSVEGVSVGTDVRLAGVRVGAVTDTQLNLATYRADTTFSISQGIEIPDDSAIAISSEGLLGGSFVEIIPGGSPFALEPGDAIIDTQSSVSLVTLLMRFVGGDGQ